MERPTEEQLGEWGEALTCAIGWISAGTNEGNHATSQWTRDRLKQLCEYVAYLDGRDAA